MSSKENLLVRSNFKEFKDLESLEQRVFGFLPKKPELTLDNLSV